MLYEQYEVWDRKFYGPDSDTQDVLFATPDKEKADMFCSCVPERFYVVKSYFVHKEVINGSFK